jgi:hypothetical protein
MVVIIGWGRVCGSQEMGICWLMNNVTVRWKASVLLNSMVTMVKTAQREDFKCPHYREMINI